MKQMCVMTCVCVMTVELAAVGFTAPLLAGRHTTVSSTAKGEETVYVPLQYFVIPNKN